MELFELKLCAYALTSRIGVILLQYLSNISANDHENDGFKSPAFETPTSDYVSNTVFHYLGGLARWDAQHFLHIIAYGYVYEHSLAFFPAYPAVVRVCADFLPLEPPSAYLAAALLLNVLFFVLATLNLYKLTLQVTHSLCLARTAATLFCFNPASIFFTAPYSEAMFAYLTFSCMGSSSWLRGSVLAALSAVTRSNGLLNVGFVCYKEFKIFLRGGNITVSNTVKFAFKTLAIFLISSSLFLIYQLYGRERFCSSKITVPVEISERAKEKYYVVPGESRDLCHHPLPYAFIQRYYWNVGLFNYYRLEELPNFVLAFPAVYFTFKACFLYFAKNKALLKTLALRGEETTAANAFPYMVHAIFLLAFCVTCVHVQVTTRMICSSSPVLYWFGAVLKEGGNKNDTNRGKARWLDWFFKSYFLVGTFLFSNAFPWT